MTSLRRWSLTSRILLALVPPSVIVFLMALFEAFVVPPVGPGTPGVRVAPLATNPVPATPSLSHDELLRTVAAGPFRPDRSRPRGRYRPEGPGTGAPSPQASVPFPREIRLHGTATLEGKHSLAAISQGRVSRLFHAGDTISGFTLVRIEPGVVFLADPDTTVTLRMAGPTPDSS